jgi:hypothetical protein
MKSNKLVISFNKSVHEVFLFTITPPNSAKWIPDVIKEETNELPIHVGTVYKLQTKNGNSFEVTVSEFKENKSVEWISTDKNFHCRYTYRPLDENSSELEYYEWVDKGELDEPFTMEVLEKLKSVIESLQHYLSSLHFRLDSVAGFDCSFNNPYCNLINQFFLNGSS